MQVFDSEVQGVKLIRQKAHSDDRGTFMELHNRKLFEELGLPFDFPQSNYSTSTAGVLRGMHLQKHNPQGKLLRCLSGTIFDCWVDMRPESPTFRKFGGITLKAEPNEEGFVEGVYLPPGLAHGFLTLSHFASVHYLCTTLYDKESDGGVHWSSFGVEWPMPEEFQPKVSEKDSKLPSLDEYLESLS